MENGFIALDSRLVVAKEKSFAGEMLAYTSDLSGGSLSAARSRKRVCDLYERMNLMNFD